MTSTDPTPEDDSGDRESSRERSVWKALKNYSDKLDERWVSLLKHGARTVLAVGPEKHGHQPIRTLYFGSGLNCDFILQSIYDRREVFERTIERMWRASSWVNAHGGDADLIVLDIPWPYHRLLSRKRFLECPAWVTQRLALTGGWEEIENRFCREAKTSDIRRIYKFGLDYRITRDRRDMAAFYDDMYLPYLVQRFGASASFEPKSTIMDYAESGKLIHITKGEQIVAAAVLYELRGCLHCLWLGTSEDPNAAIAKAAFSALYYYSIRHAIEVGCTLVDFGSSRPVLNNGVFRFKRKWGSFVCDGWSLDTILFKPQRFSPAMVSFLTNTPLIVRNGNDLVGKVFFDENRRPCGSNDLAEVIKRYGGGGLKHLEISSTGGFTRDAQEYAQSSLQAVRLMSFSQIETALGISAFK